MGKLSRSKGHQFERDVANDLKEIFPDAKRHLEFQLEEAALGVDIDPKTVFPLAIQCKRGKSYAPITKIKEIKLNQGHLHMLVTKADKEEAVCVMYWDDVLLMLKKLKSKNLI